MSVPLRNIRLPLDSTKSTFSWYHSYCTVIRAETDVAAKQCKTNRSPRCTIASCGSCWKYKPTAAFSSAVSDLKTANTTIIELNNKFVVQTQARVCLRTHKLLSAHLNTITRQLTATSIKLGLRLNKKECESQ